jgi:hypothetical protein
MALPTSGIISLNEFHIEAGGTTGTLAAINDSDIRGLIGKGSEAAMSFNEWYGASSASTAVNTWTGNSTNNRLITTGIAPDLVAIKFISETSDISWCVTDSVRGAGLPLRFDRQLAESSSANTQRTFESNGFKTGTSSLTNQSPYNYVGYSFVAGGTASSNTTGTITSTVSAGDYLSICTYTGNGTSGATYGHGLSGTPDIVFTKRTSSSGNWVVSGAALGTNYYSYLDLTNPAYYSTFIPQPGSSAITLNTSAYRINASGSSYVSYCFKSVAGKAKIAQYTGNGSSSGPTVSLGFEPSILIIKRLENTGSWLIWDNVRDTSNPNTNTIEVDNDNGENTSGLGVDFNSSSFQVKTNNVSVNASGEDYVYLAFA